MGDEKPIDQLKVTFSVLHELSQGVVPKPSDYGIEKERFYVILENLIKTGFIRNAHVSTGSNGVLISATYDNARVTLQGLEYLHQNSALMKTYRGLKEVRDWIPFIF